MVAFAATIFLFIRLQNKDCDLAPGALLIRVVSRINFYGFIPTLFFLVVKNLSCRARSGLAIHRDGDFGICQNVVIPTRMILFSKV